MDWDAELSYFVTPKSGPMRPMRTLRDVTRAFLDDLPREIRYRPHWQTLGMLVRAAAMTRSAVAIHIATDALVGALEREGWMKR